MSEESEFTEWKWDSLHRRRIILLLIISFFNILHSINIVMNFRDLMVLSIFFITMETFAGLALFFNNSSNQFSEQMSDIIITLNISISFILLIIESYVVTPHLVNSYEYIESDGPISLFSLSVLIIVSLHHTGVPEKYIYFGYNMVLFNMVYTIL